MQSIDLFTIVVDPQWCSAHSNTLGHLWAYHKHDDGSESFCITGIKIEVEQHYLLIHCSTHPNGEPQWVRLHHGVVVAILEVANRNSPPGFVHPSESLE